MSFGLIYRRERARGFVASVPASRWGAGKMLVEEWRSWWIGGGISQISRLFSLAEVSETAPIKSLCKS